MSQSTHVVLNIHNFCIDIWLFVWNGTRYGGHMAH